MTLTAGENVGKKNLYVTSGMTNCYNYFGEKYFTHKKVKMYVVP